MNLTLNNNSNSQPAAAVIAASSVAVRRILLADDDAEMRAMVTWALEREGYKVQECHDGASLKKWIDRSRSRSTNVAFDLVISDIRMPGLTGLDVLADVQSRGNRLPVILVSAFCDAETEDQARRLGAAALLPKPFEVDDLLARVRQLLPDPDAAAIGAPFDEEDEEVVEPSFPIDITFLHRDGDDEINDFVLRLAGRLERHADRIHRCRVVIDPFGPGTDGGHQLSLIVSTDGRPVVAEVEAGREEGTEKLRQALRHAFDIATRQLDERRAQH